MDYAHLPSFLRDDHEERRWKKQIKKPFPKQLLGYEIASNVYDKEDEYHTARKALGLNQNDAVPIRIATLGSITTNDNHDNPSVEEDENQRKMDAVLNKAVEDLSSLGVNARSYYHKYKPFENSETTIFEPILYLPLMKPPEKTGGLPQRDIDGAAIFLAYLLRHGHLTEKDCARPDVAEGRFTDTGFSSTILALAKSPSIQAKIRSLDGPVDVQLREK